MNPQVFIEEFRTARASAIIRTDSESTARKAMDAAVRAGFRVCEFTLTVPGALGLIAEFAARPGLIVGAGTVITPSQATEAVRAGASFLVSPVMDPEVIARAGELGVAMMPGCATPTEMLNAHRAGAQLLKLFPAPAGGPAWVSSVLAPMPFLKIVPTNGITAENAAAYLKAGAFAVGFVGSIFDPADLRAGDFDAVEAKCRAVLAATRTA